MNTLLRVAVPSPLRQTFDYLPPPDCPAERARQLAPGIRVRVPLGARQVIGLLMGIADRSEVSPAQLKPAAELLDEVPVLPPHLLALVQWAAEYYQHPLGECVQQALPVALRRGEAAAAMQQRWRLTVAGLALPERALKRAPQQARVLSLLLAEPSATAQRFAAADIKPEHLRALRKKGLVESYEGEIESSAPEIGGAITEPLLPSPEQARAIAAVRADFGSFRCHLLEGITGSGKTEVYLHLLAEVLARGQQALVLVPEIGLTPQTLARFQRRLPTPIALLHSGLNDSERLNAWRAARSGQAGVILGTRSAVFADCPRLGLIIVDEEHDASYKQQDGFRYHARDVAIKRAAAAGIPILLGSATPSLESLHNALQGRYGHQQLRTRAGAATEPAIDIVDIRRAPMRDGLAPPVIEAIDAALRRGEQALVFLNRRGFAPTLLCHDCGWISQCHHCDARLTVHIGARRLLCHHCGHAELLPARCPHCRSGQLEFRGPGTERLEHALQKLFPQAPIIRVDRDTTARKHALQDMVREIRQGQAGILVGTQMLAKGHHFPEVTLVALVDVDGGLCSADFRGPERLGQLLTQVAGRAGRAEKAGRVLVQTHYPDHPLLTALVRQGYHPYARGLLEQRRLSALPPFGHLALVRADARSLDDAESLLAALRRSDADDPVRWLGPLPAPLTRRAGLFRAQLLLQAPQRAPLHRALDRLCADADQHPLARRVKWSIDVDPLDLS